ncbi:MAG: uncharacterized protein JWL73_3274 [Actinomycetia bacterium]|nr:uncharacterized protein [Actinomycetes bacterium]
MPAEVATAANVLWTCVRAAGDPVPDELLPSASAEGWSDLPAAAYLHSSAPAAYLSLRGSASVPAPVLADLRTRYDAAFRHHLLTWDVLRQVTTLLDDAGIDHVALKGPVLAETAYPRPDLRQYGDLDVLVRPTQFEAALHVLEAAGATLIESNWELVLHLLKGELNLVMPQGIVVDLHWSVAYNDEIRQGFRWSDERFVDRATRVRVGGDEISVPDPVDQLLHLCAHACLAGAHRLGWLQDVRFAATRTPIDWPRFWARAERRRLTLPAVVVLERVERCFGSAVAEVPRGGGAWRELAEGLDRVRPPWRWTGGPMSAHVFAASTRTSSRTSLAALRRAVGASVDEVAHDRAHPLRPAWLREAGNDGINEMCRPVGGLSTRRAYFRAVAGAGRPVSP